MSNIKINELAPDFEIVDFNGKKIKLSSFKQKKNVLLVLNRGFV